MAFSLPQFDLLCDIYTGPWLTKVLRVPAHPCNLAWGKRCQVGPQFDAAADQLTGQPQMVLLLPAGTDVRSKIISGQGDIVEVPASSGRWYGVFGVDDLGKGFPNEHRGAYVLAISKYLNPVTYAGLTPPVPWP